MRFYTNHSNDPYYNLALEEYMTQTAKGEVLMLWRNAPAIIIGRNQNPADELDINAAKAMGIKIVRRMSGGGAVYHDLGNINFSYISQRTDRFGDFMAFAGPILDFLHQNGVNAQHIGNNDIGIEGRKISGNAQYIYQGNILHHGTLLFDTDLTVLSKVLTPDPAKLENKGIRSVRSRVVNLSDYLHMDRNAFWQAINAYFSGLPSVEDINTQAVERLRAEKYATDEWNFGAAPAFFTPE